MRNKYSYIFLISETNVTPAVETTTNMVKYRILYAFEARNPDELSVMPGDVVLVSI